MLKRTPFAIGAVVARRYRVTALLGACADTSLVAAQSLPSAFADHGRSDVVLCVLDAHTAHERTAFARAALADSHVLDFGRTGDGRLFSAAEVQTHVYDETPLLEDAA